MRRRGAVRSGRIVALHSIARKTRVVRIGPISITTPSEKSAYSPHAEFLPSSSPAVASQLQWMMKKDLLKQDWFILGQPTPYKRWLALKFCGVLNKEVEFISITRDTSEADIKQRREIVNGSVVWVDQPAVRAALNGRVLILEGIEKAERNVLPILNNLLENREMSLEDGTFLMSPSRYDELAAQLDKGELERNGFRRVHPDFRVIALGIPVPKYSGTPLDPPVRSRFQCLSVETESMENFYDVFTNSDRNLDCPFTFACALREIENKWADKKALPPFTTFHAVSWADMLRRHPAENALQLLASVYPYHVWLADHPTEAGLFQDTAVKCGLSGGPLAAGASGPPEAPPPQPASPVDPFVSLPSHGPLLRNMEFDLRRGRPVLLLGEAGSGKSVVMRELLRRVGLARPEKMFTDMIFTDMSSRDLIQRRVTKPSGDTDWEFTNLLNAAIGGGVAVMDGVEKLKRGSLSFLNRLLVDHSMQLFDGSLILSREERAMLSNPGSMIREIHPDFRVMALASPTQVKGGKKVKDISWLDLEMTSIFSVHQLPRYTDSDIMFIVRQLYPDVPPSSLESLRSFIAEAGALHEKDPAIPTLSLRQAARVMKYLQRGEDLHTLLWNTLLLSFVPQFQRDKIISLMRRHSITAGTARWVPPPAVTESPSGAVLSIGGVTAEVGTGLTSKDSMLVPRIHFVDSPQNSRALQAMLKAFTGGDHLLLIGNQGVGKNKFADRLLQLLRLPRQYIQLHRDTTVQSLTIAPQFSNGVLQWGDSPLVLSMLNGYVLVIDEIDKAPLEVVAVLKGVIEDRCMTLLDGRRLSADPAATGANLIQIHPNFRIIALANRPGFPFLGNNFFAECGDVFSCHIVDNSDRETQLALLREFGPNVPQKTLDKLIDSFVELDKHVQQGTLSYPYSSRELVNIVKHLETFPSDSIGDAIANVFSFDAFDTNSYAIIKAIFSKKGVAMKQGAGVEKSNSIVVEEFESNSPPDPKEDNLKHGKEDDKPHVGGNTYAGGTGGTDTAGLGGLVGPYRLDKGFPIHQVSREAKAKVPEHIKRKAKEMGRAALKKRLEEIKMSEKEDSVYTAFLQNVSGQIAVIHEMLKGIQSKDSERIWLKNKSEGVLDDSKVVDAVVGERAVYKRRGESDDLGGSPTHRKKHLQFLMDCSASMYRFNGHDGRLTRVIETTAMLIESFRSYEEKIHYEIVGHNGDSDRIPLTSSNPPPQNRKEVHNVLMSLVAQSQYCSSGDNTLESIKAAVKRAGSLSGETYEKTKYVFVVSDANLEMYGVTPSALKSAVLADPSVKVFCIFVAVLDSGRYSGVLPQGQSFTCLKTSDLPAILKAIFLSEGIVN